jgi:hypothetical protein
MKQTKWSLRLVALLSVLVLIVAACGDGGGESTTTEADPGADTTAAPDTTEPSTDTTEPMTDTTVAGDGTGR